MEIKERLRRSIITINGMMETKINLIRLPILPFAIASPIRYAGRIDCLTEAAIVSPCSISELRYSLELKQNTKYTPKNAKLSTIVTTFLLRIFEAARAISHPKKQDSACASMGSVINTSKKLITPITVKLPMKLYTAKAGIMMMAESRSE